MSYQYYRFYFLDSENTELLNRDGAFDTYQRILTDDKELGIIRVSLDLVSADKSISILCESDEDVVTEQAKWARFLLESGFPISRRIESQVLEEEKDEEHHMHDHDEEHHHDHHHDHHENHWQKAAWGLAWGIGMLALSLATFNIPMMAYYAITGLSVLMTLYLGRTVYQSAWRALREKKWGMSTLYTISTLTIVVVSIASIFVPGLPMMLESAPLVLGFWHLGEAIEHHLLDKINTKLDVRDCVPPSITLKNNPNRNISVKQLIPNDIILVKGGEVIPVDGVVTQSTLLYTTRIDGSPYLKEFKPGDAVKAGMCLAAHLPTLEMRVTKTYQNSYLSLIANNISQANDEKAPVELFANKVLKYFVPGLLAVAIISGITVGLLFPPALALQCVISVLVSACPCALSLITPMAVKIGMNKASEQGVHFKNGKTLQAAADIDTIVFDLNGTLTQGKVSVNSLNIADKKLLRYVALLEKQSDHPVAKTIHSYIEKQKLDDDDDEPLEITEVDTSHHSGIKAIINGETFMIGNQDMLFENNIKHIDTPYNNPENGSVYIVRNATVIGQIDLTDPLRKDAIATVNQLRALGKTIHLCTGADRVTAEKYAALLGIPNSNICANTVGVATEPGERSKTSYITQLKNNGHKVAMVGDAANDIPAIASADIGIAVRSTIGDTITEQYAGIVVHQGLLFPIATAFDVSKKTKQNIVQNLFVSLTYNSVITLVASGLFVALGFALNPAVGVALMVLESAIVLTNLYRLKHQPIISLDARSENEISDDDDIEETTSSVLNSLDYQPQNTLEISREPIEIDLSPLPAFRAPYTRRTPTFFSPNEITPPKDTFNQTWQPF